MELISYISQFIINYIHSLQPGHSLPWFIHSTSYIFMTSYQFIPELFDCINNCEEWRLNGYNQYCTMILWKSYETRDIGAEMIVIISIKYKVNTFLKYKSNCKNTQIYKALNIWFYSWVCSIQDEYQSRK